MKKIGILLITLAAVLFITSCEKDKTGPFINKSAAAPLITAPTGGTTFVFLETDEISDSVTFTWTVPDYGYDASVLYALEIAQAGTSFAAPVSVANVYKPEAKLSVGDFNMKILTLGGIAGEQADYELRVKSTVHPTIPILTSSLLAVKITPYEKVIIYPKLYVPGDHNGWDQTNESTVIYSVGFNDIFEGYLWFKDATTYFKMLKGPAWVQTDCIGDANASGTSGTLVVGDWGNNIKVDGGIGYFLIKANLVEKTYSWMKTDWGIIGPGQPGGWDNDSNLSYSVATGLWTATLDLTADKIKFRANNSWDLNYGDNGADKKLELNGADISVASAGNYTVTLDLRGPIYRYTLVKN